MIKNSSGRYWTTDHGWAKDIGKAHLWTLKVCVPNTDENEKLVKVRRTVTVKEVV